LRTRRGFAVSLFVLLDNVHQLIPDAERAINLIVFFERRLAAA
jgi:hypothetical protein